MPDFIYTTVPGKIKLLLAKIRQVGVPGKATMQWLKSIGFTSSNDSSLIGVLKFVGLTDQSGVPTTAWTAYRGGTHKSVLGECVRRGYGELFSTYADAERRDNTDLDHFFSTSSTGGKQVIAKTIATFKALAEEASFEGAAIPNDSRSGNPAHPQQSDGRNMGNRFLPSVHIDVQVHISPDATADQIDQVFASMAKHLYGVKKSEG